MKSIEVARVTRPINPAGWRDDFAHELWRGGWTDFDCYSPRVGATPEVVLLGTGQQVELHKNTGVFDGLEPGKVADFLDENLPSSCQETLELRVGALSIYNHDHGRVLIVKLTNPIVRAETVAVRSLVSQAVGCSLPWSKHINLKLKLAGYNGPSQERVNLDRIRKFFPDTLQAGPVLVGRVAVPVPLAIPNGQIA